MTRVEFLYLLPYLLSLALSAGVATYTWRHRRIQGAGAYAILSSAQTLAVFGFILELISPDLNGKLIWDKFQWITFAVEAVAIPIFVVQYTKYPFPRARIGWVLIALLPVSMMVMVMADPWLHIIYPNPHLVQAFLFGELVYDFTWFTYLFAAYGYTMTAFSFFVLAQRIVRPARLYRAQVTIIIVGLLIPVFGTALPFFGIQLTPLRDASPFTTAIGNMIVALGLYRYRLFDVKPIARETLFEKTPDLVIILDAQDRIVDMNHAALGEFGLTPEQVIGKPFSSFFFYEWEEFHEPIEGNKEIFIKRNEEYFHFDVRTTLLHDSRGQYQGRIFVARDITPYAVLQWQLKELNEDLERRVQARTEELAEAYDTTLEGWARALELRDKETEGHSWRVTELTMKLSLAVGVPYSEFDHIRRGAILHDIGKMAIPDEILRKTGPLSPQERLVVIEHPTIAYQLLSRIPFLEKALDIPYCHHEKWDGTGYPRGLKGEDIPLAARIFAVVDVWDAIQSDRPYKAAWSREDAIAHLQEQAGKYFDPKIVDIFLNLVKEGKI
ncbi:MAG: HD domain-containing phosphohydrolase [Chloroflexota bacterium]